MAVGVGVAEGVVVGVAVAVGVAVGRVDVHCTTMREVERELTRRKHDRARKVAFFPRLKVNVLRLVVRAFAPLHRIKMRELVSVGTVSVQPFERTDAELPRVSVLATSPVAAVAVGTEAPRTNRASPTTQIDLIEVSIRS